jgi:hypothetical protein
VINLNDIDGFFVFFDEVKKFLVLFEIFSRFFVKVKLKKIFARFLANGFFGEFLP